MKLYQIYFKPKYRKGDWIVLNSALLTYKEGMREIKLIRSNESAYPDNVYTLRRTAIIEELKEDK